MSPNERAPKKINKIEKLSDTKTVDVKRAEHLKKGVQPVFACVGEGTIKDFLEGVFKNSAEGDLVTNVHDVDFEEKSAEAYKKKGFENDDWGSYVISPIDNFAKYSKEFYNCTGIIVVGTDKTTRDNISFMSHQNPEYFLEGDQKFSKSLTERLKEIKDRCEVGTIDAVIVGGGYAEVREIKAPDPAKSIFIEEYLKSIKFLTEIIKKELGFEPLVITGPKTIPTTDCVFYDNEKRRLYLMRGKNDFNAMQSFTPSEIEKMRKKWKPGEWGLPV